MIKDFTKLNAGQAVLASLDSLGDTIRRRPGIATDFLRNVL